MPEGQESVVVANESSQPSAEPAPPEGSHSFPMGVLMTADVLIMCADPRLGVPLAHRGFSTVISA